ncbi:DUF1761 domain-containing protein [Ensifer adhaerens]|uniref:DUF1761 domain-containing protein n=1 Tax=Ensifer adhaerens TaxID=106592 RepID=UPI0031589832
MKAARIDPAATKMSPVLFATSFVSELVMATMVAGVVRHLGPGAVALANGVVSAFFLWLGFIATMLVANHGFGWDLSLIDGGHWLLALLAMGAIIGAMGASGDPAGSAVTNAGSRRRRVRKCRSRSSSAA